MIEKDYSLKFFVTTGLAGIIFYLFYLTRSEILFPSFFTYLFFFIQIVSIILLISIFIFPCNSRLFTLIVYISGVTMVLMGSQINGIILYILGLYRHFISDKKRNNAKVILVSAVFFTAVILQIRIGIVHMLITFFWTLLISLFLASMYMACKDSLPDTESEEDISEEDSTEPIIDYREAVLIDENQKEILDLEKLNLSDKRMYAIASVEAGSPYKVIGHEMKMSESAVKNMMRRLFKLFDVLNREELRVLLSRYTLKYPPGFILPKNQNEEKEVIAYQSKAEPDSRRGQMKYSRLIY